MASYALVMNGLLFWAVYAVLLPSVLACLSALPFWYKRRILLGNLIGSLLVALIVIVLIWQQYGTAVQSSQTCANCLTDVNTLFVPFFILVGLGWLDVLLVLIVGGIVESRRKVRWSGRESM